MSPVLSVVIPAYDEAERIGPTLRRVDDYLARRGAPFEILLVDDGSRDATARVAAECGLSTLRVLSLETNRGKGAAVRHGVAASRGDRVLLCDADLSTPVEEVETLEQALAEGADLAIGSRAQASSRLDQRQPFYRERMGKTFNLLVRLLVVGGFRDTQCGFKLLSRRVARDVFPRLTIDRFAYDVELVWLTRRLGFQVAEVGVRWSDSPDSRVHPVVDSVRMLADLLRMRWRHRGSRTERAKAETS